jgi:hypothetical protein
MGLRSDIDEALDGLGTSTTAITNLTNRVEDLEMGISLALKYDQDMDPPTVAYLGQALPGTSTATAGWRIQKLAFAVDGDVSVTWADGNADMDNIWDNRAGLTYS